MLQRFILVVWLVRQNKKTPSLTGTDVETQARSVNFMFQEEMAGLVTALCGKGTENRMLCQVTLKRP